MYSRINLGMIHRMRTGQTPSPCVRAACPSMWHAALFEERTQSTGILMQKVAMCGLQNTLKCVSVRVSVPDPTQDVINSNLLLAIFTLCRSSVQTFLKAQKLLRCHTKNLVILQSLKLVKCCLVLKRNVENVE